MITKLTKENFFNELYEKYRGEMEVFCKWIDEYKKRVEWDLLFNNGSLMNIPPSSTDERLVHGRQSVKFHDLPIAMQIGIFLQFVAEQQSGLLEISVEHPTDFEKIPELIRQYFFYEHDDAVTDHQNAKHGEVYNIHDEDY